MQDMALRNLSYKETILTYNEFPRIDATVYNWSNLFRLVLGIHEWPFESKQMDQIRGWVHPGTVTMVLQWLKFHFYHEYQPRIVWLVSDEPSYLYLWHLKKNLVSDIKSYGINR